MSDASRTDERKFMHDISNPLTVASGHAKIIVKKLGDQPADGDLSSLKIPEKVTKIRTAVDRMIALCDERLKQL